MTSLEAIQAVEDSLGKLQFVDKYGEIIPGDMMGGIAIHLLGEPWESLSHRFFIEQSIPAQEYVTAALGMVEEMGRIDARKRLEKKLAGQQLKFQDLPKT